MLMRIWTYSKIILLFSFLLTLRVLASGDLVYAENGMVVSANEIASHVGVEILRKGGNAVDAAVATGFTLAVTYPSAGNLGGGGFMVLHLADGENTIIDFREKAPLDSSQDMFLDENGEYDSEKSLKGWTSSGVPGSVDGLIYVLKKYGTMNLSEVIQPAIDIAEGGFELDYWLCKSINKYNGEFNNYSSSNKIFTNNGDSLEIGSLFVQPDLAKTLKRIKNLGRAGFYEGVTAHMIVDQSRINGGLISLEDLKQYKSVERQPINGTYKGYTVIGMPLPSAGGIGIIESLHTLAQFEFNSIDYGSSDYIHTVTEVLKYVYSDRASYLGDSDFIEAPVEYLISENRGNEIANLVGDSATPSKQIKNDSELTPESEETTHFSVVDKEGNAVSTTVSINSSYGNKIVVDGAGFLMNNHMDDFTAKVGEENQFGLVGSKANAIEPEKRMLSSMSPTILLKDDKPFLIVGSPGGSKIITSVLQVILNVVNFEMDIQEAVNMPRFHHQWLPDEIKYEKYAINKDVQTDLSTRGHKLKEVEIIGRVEAILFDENNNLYWGTSDRRGYGKAAGY